MEINNQIMLYGYKQFYGLHEIFMRTLQKMFKQIMNQADHNLKEKTKK